MKNDEKQIILNRLAKIQNGLNAIIYAVQTIAEDLQNLATFVNTRRGEETNVEQKRNS